MYIKTRVISFKFVNKYYKSTTVDPSQRPSTLLVKGKGMPRSRRTPTRPGIVGTTRTVRHDTQLREGMLPAQHFHFHVGPPVEQTDIPPAAGLDNRKKGKIQLQHGSQEILCQTGLVNRVGAFRISTTPTKFVLLILLYYQYYHYTTSRYVHGTTSQEQKMGRSCFG